MNLPYSDNLNIGYLSRLFDRNRVFNCYKYFWMLAILNKISVEILYLIFDYPHKHYTFKYFEV